jgi:hypothetical protein
MSTGPWNGTPPGDVPVRVRGLRKSYGDRVAVDGLDLESPDVPLARRDDG